MSTRYNPSIVRDNLVLYLDAANTKSYPGSGTTWKDISGKGNHGTLTNGPTFDSNNLGSIDFDGTNDHVVLSSPVMTSFSKVSVFCFIKYNDLSHSHKIIDMRDASGDGFSFSMSSPSGDKLFSSLNSSSIVGTKVFSLGEIHSCAVTYDGSTAKLYVDGEEDKSSNISETFSITNPSKIAARRFNTGSATPSEINLYNLIVYSNGLTATQIKQNHNALKGRFGL